MIKKDVIKTYCLSILIIVFHIVLALSFHSTLGTDSFESTLIADLVMLCFCGGQYATLKSRYKHEAFLKPKFVFSWTTFFRILGVMIVFTYFALTAMTYITLRSQDQGVVVRNDAFSSHSPVLVTIFSVVIAPVVEEVIYRLFIYNYTKRVSSWLPAMLFTSFLFAIQHMTLAHTIVATAFGVALTLIYEFTGRKLIVTILCHMMFNSMTLILPMKIIFYNNTFAVLVSFVFILAVCMIGSLYMYSKCDAVAGNNAKKKQIKKK